MSAPTLLGDIRSARSALSAGIWAIGSVVAVILMFLFVGYPVLWVLVLMVPISAVPITRLAIALHKIKRAEQHLET